jgi:antitoxin component HigA of HigAB toxin-antitoxin module
MSTPIETEEQYHKALARAYHLMQMDFEVGSDLYNELDALGTLVEEYEAVHYPIRMSL